MLLKSKNKHKKDGEVVEHPNYGENHIYIINGICHNHIGFKSVTTFIKDYFEEFNADKIIGLNYNKWQSDKDNIYYGKTPEEIKLIWDTNRDTRAEAGTYMHLQFENYLNGLEVDNIPEMATLKRFLKERKLVPWRTEMSIYSDKWKIVGNVDLIVDNGDGTFDIYDWKRKKSVKDNSYSKKCKYPLNRLGDHEKNKYALQLSVYKQIYEEHYIMKIKNLWNVLIEDDVCKVIKQKYIKLLK